MKRGWQAELARKSGIPPTTLSEIINRKHRPRKETAKKLESVTGISWLAWIYPEEFENPYIRQAALSRKTKQNARS